MDKILEETKVEAHKQFPEMTEDQIADVAYQICELSRIIVESYFAKVQKENRRDLGEDPGNPRRPGDRTRTQQRPARKIRRFGHRLGLGAAARRQTSASGQRWNGSARVGVKSAECGVSGARAKGSGLDF